MASRTSSVSDVTGFAPGGNRSPPRIRDFHSPMSNFSMQSSQDTGSVFEYPDYMNERVDRSQYDDYSHIQYPVTRKYSMPVVTAPEPPLRTSSVQSFTSDYTHRSYTTGHHHPSAQNGQYYNRPAQNQQNQQYGGHLVNGHSGNTNGSYYNAVPRRKTWTPSGLKIPAGITSNGMGNSNNSLRNCHSNDILENNKETSNMNRSLGQLNSESDIAPPRLAPVSGILPRVRLLFTPFQFVLIITFT